MKRQQFVPNPALVSLLGLAPLVGATATFADGLVIGLLAVVGALLGYGASNLARRHLEARLVVPVQLAAIGIYASLCLVALGFWSSALVKELGIYVPLLAVNGFVVHEARRTGNRPVAGFPPILATGLGYLAVALVVSVLREVGGAGTISLPLPGASPREIAVVPFPLIPLLRSPAGGFLVLGAFAAVNRLLTPAPSGRGVTR